MKTLLTADWHLSERVLDAYRWDIFPWLRKLTQKDKSIGTIMLLGDVTDAKDRHSETLVNRLVDEISTLAASCPVIFLPGNHDGIQEGRPFFRFLEKVPGLSCILEPTQDDTPYLGKTLMLPHTRDYFKAWEGIDFAPYDYIFCHQTFHGCLAENGIKLEGVPPAVFGRSRARVFSGDIHVPQKVGARIEYVGSPWRVHFGDQFYPRLLLVWNDNGKHHQDDIHFDTVNRSLFETSEDRPAVSFARMIDGIPKGDQIKLRVFLERSAYPQWPEMRKAIVQTAKDAGVVLIGPELHALESGREKAPQDQNKAQLGASPQKALDSFAKSARLSAPFLVAGKRYLTEAQK